MGREGILKSVLTIFTWYQIPVWDLNEEIGAAKIMLNLIFLQCFFLHLLLQLDIYIKCMILFDNSRMN